VIRLARLVWDFVKVDCHRTQYVLILGWAAALLFFNYTVNLENGVIDRLPRNGLRFLGYFTLYSTAYYTAVWITTHFKKTNAVFRSSRFWIVSAAGLIFFSADSGFIYHDYLLDWIEPNPKLRGFLFAVLANGTEFITIALPLFLINHYLIKNRHEKLGVNSQEADLKPFFLILLLIAPFIFVSAFEAGMNSYYPKYKFGYAAEIMDVSPWIPAAIYEFLYGADFFNVELVFRGFFVIGMSAILGRDAVVPMAVFYCAIHFGKPGLEACSSLFGGYILGIVAYQTRSILGGVIVHIGLAWIMELSAFVVKSFASQTP
jgi:hypothetical protein